MATTEPAKAAGAIEDARHGDREHARVDATPTAQLPFELHVMIIDQLHPNGLSGLLMRDFKKAMATLSLVCKAWREEGQKRLFATFVFDLKHCGPGTPAYNAQTLWHSQLANGDPNAHRLAGYVRECTFSNSLQRMSHRSESFLPITHSAMAHFFHAEKVTMQRMSIDDDTFLALLGMRSLRTLSLEGCAFMAVPHPSTVTMAHAMGYWTSLCLEQLYLSSEWTDLLRKATNMNTLASFASDDTEVWSLFLCPSAAPLLRTLHIHLNFTDQHDRDTLDTVLRNVPGLLELSIDTGYVHFQRRQQQPLLQGSLFPRDVIPNLQALATTSLHMIEWLVPGRPISSLAFNDHWEPGAESFFTATSGSTAAITDLTVPYRLLRLIDQDQWRALRTLTIGLKSVAGGRFQFISLDNLLTELPRLDTITSCTFQMHPRHGQHRKDYVNLRAQQSWILGTLQSAFPNVERFMFGNIVEWRRDEGGWRPRVLSRRMTDILPAQYDEAQDVDGVLAAFRAGISRAELL